MISLLERDQIISSDTGKQVGLAYANEDTSDLGSFLKSERTGGGGGKEKKRKGRRRASRDKCKNEAMLSLLCCLLR